MDVVVAVLLFLLGFTVIACGAITLIGRQAAARRRAAAEAARALPWETAESSTTLRLPGGTRGATQVIVRRVTAEGTVLDRIVIDTIRDDDDNWHERMLTARAHAAERAELLNTRP